jgi:hypothetical protein
MIRFWIVVLISLMAVNAAVAQEATNSPEANLFFDDFAYAATDDEVFAERGWIVRSVEGWPGVSGATWSTDAVTVVEDPDDEDNRLVQMISSTDGTPENTVQTQFCQSRKFLYGTYAARVRFSDAPEVGPDGDSIVQTFYTISPLAFDLDPDYSELDFEYLPNGGWGFGDSVFFTTTWETFRPEPNWLADNVSQNDQDSYEGWHVLVMQVTDSAVKYYVDGDLFAFHTGKFVPEVPMSINFNLWFVNGGLVGSNEAREYVEYVDWVFHAADAVLSPEAVESQIETLREAGVNYVDDVPPLNPVLESPCNF